MQEGAEQLNELLRENLSEAIAFVRGAAPEVWEIFVRQQYVLACAWILWFVVAALATRAVHSRIDWDDPWGLESGLPLMLALTFLAITLLIAGTGVIVEALPRLANAHYYALKDLLP